jgi:hypothetical protein
LTIEGSITLGDGRTVVIDGPWLLAPLEKGLRAMSWGVVLLATAMAISRLG